MTAPRMNPERVQPFVGEWCQVLEVDHLRHKARVGVPVDVQPGEDLAKEIAYENHSSTKNVHEAVW